MMPCYQITFSHSAMKPDYRGIAYKYANSPEEAAKLLGKYSKKDNTVLDSRGSLLSDITINEEKS